MEIDRDKYLRDLATRRGNGLVKVVTGARRAGKSYLLFKLYRDLLREEGVPDDRIVELAFDLRSSRPLRDPDAFLEWGQDQRCAQSPQKRRHLRQTDQKMVRQRPDPSEDHIEDRKSVV